MKVLVASSGPDLGAAMDPRFGRCAYFVVVDSESMEFKAMENPGAAMGMGAGIQAAQAAANAGADAVIAGNFGPNAFHALSAGGLKVYIGTGGTVRQQVEALKAGQLQEVSEPNVSPHFGMGGGGMGRGGGMGSGAGGGGGMGRGMGMCGGIGRGRGMGAGCEMGWGAASGMPGFNTPAEAAGTAPGVGGAAEVEGLKAQVEALRRQADALEQRLRTLQGKSDG